MTGIRNRLTVLCALGRLELELGLGRHFFCCLGRREGGVDG